MSAFDQAKDAVGKAVDSQGEKISDGLEKAADFIDDKTGGKFSGQIDAGVAKVEDALDALDGKNDDIS